MIQKENYKIWVLAPSIESVDDNINYFYDFSQSIQEYDNVFKELNYDWQWQYITLKNYATIISEIIQVSSTLNQKPIFFNLCDGDEINETPGISIIHYLENNNQIYTGADAFFYEITTSKETMKKAFDDNAVKNAKWVFIRTIQDLDKLKSKYLPYPLIVKPAISGGSMGVGVKNVVHNFNELYQQVKEMLAGYRGWNLNAGGIILEQFITGKEYTVFLTGNFNQPKNANIYTPVERVFHKSLPEEEQFLSFDRLWEIYEDEVAMPNQENFYEYALPDENIIEELKMLSWNAFVACKGKSYTRVDIRKDNTTNELFVLEVNAQCGLSEDENYTSIGAILKFSNKSFSSLVNEIINNALSTYNKFTSTKEQNALASTQLI